MPGAGGEPSVAKRAEMRLVPLAILALVAFASPARADASQIPTLVPAPRSIAPLACSHPPRANALVFPMNVDLAGLAIVGERWTALGIGDGRARNDANVKLAAAIGGREHYHLRIDDRGVSIAASDAEAQFDALTTLAQLPATDGTLPCLEIDDAPALRWRVVSDDISRGPFPSLHYFEERIRTLAAFKVNGYSPYMEQVVVDPRAPFVAFPAALSTDELRYLARYARRFHVTLIPEQQTFAHMHETLKWETFGKLAELPHGYLMNAGDPQTYAYLEPLLRSELRAVEGTPFFHIGADEPVDLGRGLSQAAIAREGTPAVFAAHVNRLAPLLAAGGARPMIWDDAILRDPKIMTLIPRSTVIVTFHYGPERSFAGYIKTIADGGFEQMISPGANNWNEIYPDLETAFINESRFIADGKAAHVLGMFETVWHDDGESLYEATWEPVLFAAADAWQQSAVDPATFSLAFARAFFGADATRYAQDLERLRTIRTRLKTDPGDPSDYLFWADPFDGPIGMRVRGAIDLAAVRTDAEAILAHGMQPSPPLHANAARVMALAALRYDTLARRFQIGAEARTYYDDARAHADGKHESIVYRGLNVAKYLCWELRDELTAIESLYINAWNYESTPSGLDRVLVRYHAAEDAAVRDADRLNRIQREDYLRAHTLPTFDAAMGSRT